jgi:2-iminobutanoate/2-iminopropanoate deaminase
VFVSGQIPIDPETGELISTDMAAATRQSLANVEAVLAREGLTLNDVVKASIFLIDNGDYQVMDRVYSAVMPQPFPARETVFVRGLPKGARVEISVIAYAGNQAMA